MTSCTTILVGKKASYDGSTMIARNDDCPNGQFDIKNLLVRKPSDIPKTYKSVISKISIEPADLPDNPMQHTFFPTLHEPEGIWGAAGINSKNVAVSATEKQ